MHLNGRKWWIILSGNIEITDDEKGMYLMLLGWRSIVSRPSNDLGKGATIWRKDTSIWMTLNMAYKVQKDLENGRSVSSLFCMR
jgi:hypothetical protein